jgi:hypothetical protein
MEETRWEGQNLCEVVAPQEEEEEEEGNAVAFALHIRVLISC